MSSIASSEKTAILWKDQLKNFHSSLDQWSILWKCIQVRNEKLLTKPQLTDLSINASTINRVDGKIDDARQWRISLRRLLLFSSRFCLFPRFSFNTKFINHMKLMSSLRSNERDFVFLRRKELGRNGKVQFCQTKKPRDSFSIKSFYRASLNGILMLVAVEFNLKNYSI